MHCNHNKLSESVIRGVRAEGLETRLFCIHLRFIIVQPKKYYGLIADESARSCRNFSCWSFMFVWSALPTSLSALTHVGRLLSPVLSPECCLSVGSPRRSLVATAIAATVYLGVGDLYRLASPPTATLRSSCCYFYFAAMWSPTPARPSPHPLSASALPRRRRALCCNVRSATFGATVDV